MGSRLDGRYAVITGGHTNLGFAIAKRFVQEGAAVMIVGRTEDTVHSAAKALEQVGGGAVHRLVANITDASGPTAVFDAAAEAHGSLPDVLVNCAGYFLWKGMLDVSAQEWAQTLDTQLTAPFRMTQELAKRLRDADRADGASVINIGSIHGPVGDGNVVHQCAAKQGVIGLTRAAAEALRKLGTRVNALLPGAIEPDSADKASADLSSQITQYDLANSAVFLASNESRGVTGACIEAYGSSRPVIGR